MHSVSIGAIAPERAAGLASGKVLTGVIAGDCSTSGAEGEIEGALGRAT